MSIALFVDPTAAEYANAVEAATFVAETALSLDEQLILSCGALAALDISLAVLGRAVSRTVEGGERRSSPLVLLPLIRNPEDVLIDERLRPDSEGESSGTLADLVDLGIIANREESGFDIFGDRSSLEAFVETLRVRAVSIVFGLGSQSRFWTPTLRQLRENPRARLITVPEFSPPDLAAADRTILRIRRSEIPDRPIYRDSEGAGSDDEFEQFVVRARRQAALVASLIEALLERS
jgi:hypothetical protein